MGKYLGKDPSSIKSIQGGGNDNWVLIKRRLEVPREYKSVAKANVAKATKVERCMTLFVYKKVTVISPGKGNG